jgi:hypothetical protein
MGKYQIVRTADGRNVGHAANYELKDGEKKVADIDDADSVEDAEKRFKSDQKAAGARKEATEDQKEEELEQLREAEESKEVMEVVADAEGNLTVKGGESEKKAKADKKNAEKQEAKKAAKKKEEEQENPVFDGRPVKDEAEALARAKGTFKDPAEGAPRGAQTP